jgi:subtilisin-like proprotein convertase family protein
MTRRSHDVSGQRLLFVLVAAAVVINAVPVVPPARMAARTPPRVVDALQSATVCGTPTKTTFSDSTGGVLGPESMTLTSQIVVSGMDPVLWDIDVLTSVRHSFSADLDITLTSPSGTVVTLTTDNASGYNDVFAGTLWDDSATERAVDATYSDATKATLAPESPLAALRGEDPNGTWTLIVTDDFAGDGGTLDGWNLQISAMPNLDGSSRQAFSASGSSAIPDNSTSGVSRTIPVSGLRGHVLEVWVTVNITHTYPGDLEVSLESPGSPGIVVDLTTDNGATADNVFLPATFRDVGGSAVTDATFTSFVSLGIVSPEEALSAFVGTSPNGDWTLKVADDALGDTGTLGDVTLTVVAGTPACRAEVPASETSSNDSSATATALGLRGNRIGTAVGSISPAGDVDFYSFRAVAGQRIFVHAEASGVENHGFSPDTKLTLYAPDGSVIELDNADATGTGWSTGVMDLVPALIAGAPAAVGGTYTVKVEQQTGSATIPGYRLMVVVADAPEVGIAGSGATVLLQKARGVLSLDGTIGNAGSQDDFLLQQLRAGELVFVAVDGAPLSSGARPTSTLDLELTLDDASDFATPLVTADSSKTTTLATAPAAEGFAFVVPASGDYYLRVNDTGSATGAYVITAAKLTSFSADVLVTLDVPGVLAGGAALTGTAVIRNTSSSTKAANYDFFIGTAVPSALVVTPPAGWTCASGAPPVACHGDVEPGTSYDFPFSGVVPNGTASPFSFRIDALPNTTAASTPTDYNFDNNTATASVAVTTSTPTDTDGDGLSNDYETAYGLDGGDPSGENGPDGDPDGDGVTNADEQAAGTHPRGFHTRYFAEGSTQSIFTTRLALFNTDGSTPALTLLRYLTPSGSPIVEPLSIPALMRRTIDVNAVPGLGNTAVSVILEADTNVVADRTMTWDATGYGAHAETGVAGPNTTWYFAEGSTANGFSLFYLLQNPNAADANVTITYLRPDGLPTVTRTYTVPGNSRQNVWVNTEGAELAATDVSARVDSSVPIIAERAMYLDTQGQLFGAGHDSVGVTAPQLTWFLAEGATGPYFDLFVLVANPNPTDAQITATFLLPNGETVTKNKAVAANSRFTIWVDLEDLLLENTGVSTTVTSTNGVPVIVERAMWWPGTFSQWTEAHNSPGVTQTGTKWALAEGQEGGTEGYETYLLVANTSAFGGTARVTLYCEDGTVLTKDVELNPNSRTNVAVAVDFPGATGKRFGAVVEAVGSSPAQIVVERAMYASAGGVTWAAGTNAVGTRLP